MPLLALGYTFSFIHSPLYYIIYDGLVRYHIGTLAYNIKGYKPSH